MSKPQKQTHVIVKKEQALLMAFYLNLYVLPDKKAIEALHKPLRRYLRKHHLVDYKDRPYKLVEL